MPKPTFMQSSTTDVQHGRCGGDLSPSSRDAECMTGPGTRAGQRVWTVHRSSTPTTAWPREGSTSRVCASAGRRLNLCLLRMRHVCRQMRLSDSTSRCRASAERRLEPCLLPWARPSACRMDQLEFRIGSTNRGGACVLQGDQSHVCWPHLCSPDLPESRRGSTSR